MLLGLCFCYNTTILITECQVNSTLRLKVDIKKTKAQHSVNNGVETQPVQNQILKTIEFGKISKISKQVEQAGKLGRKVEWKIRHIVFTTCYVTEKWSLKRGGLSTQVKYARKNCIGAPELWS